MPNPEQEFLRAFINSILPSAMAGAVIQIVTRAMQTEVSFLGVVLSFILAITLGCLVGVLVYFKFDDITIIIIATSISSTISKDISTWFVYKIKIDKHLSSAFKGLVRYLFGKYGE